MSKLKLNCIQLMSSNNKKRFLTESFASDTRKNLSYNSFYVGAVSLLKMSKIRKQKLRDLKGQDN